MTSASRGTILFCREVAWDSPLSVSTVKLAREFLKAGWRVLWLTGPRGPFKWRRWLRTEPESVRQFRRAGRTDDPNLLAFTGCSLSPFSRVPPLCSPALLRRMWTWCVPSVRRVLCDAGWPEPDVLWLSSLHARGLVDLFPGRPVVWHVTDYYPAFYARPDLYRRLERFNYEVGDVYVFSSPILRDRVCDEYGLPSKKSHVLLHGVDEWRIGAGGTPDPLAGAARPRVVYVGNTDRADADVLEAIADRHDLSLVIVGRPVGRLHGRPNVRQTGPLDPDEVGRLLPHCDVGLVTYSPKDLTAATLGGNPMKVYEYAAAGLPIVSPPMPIYGETGCPVQPYVGAAKVVRAIEAALAGGGSVRPALWDFASRNTWAARYEEATGILADAAGRTSGRSGRSDAVGWPVRR